MKHNTIVYDLVLGVNDLSNDELYQLAVEENTLIISELTGSDIIDLQEDSTDAVILQNDVSVADESDDD